MSKLYDIVRVDHFIGFANYYSIPYGAPNARSGKWIVGPGKKLFRRLKKELPNLRVVAEDLGVQSDRVRELLKFVGYPGMKVATFGFGGDAELRALFERTYGPTPARTTMTPPPGGLPPPTKPRSKPRRTTCTLTARKMVWKPSSAACCPLRAAWRLCRCRTCCTWAAKPA